MHAADPPDLPGMSGSDTAAAADAGAIAFGDWQTPFTDACVDILDLAYGPGRGASGDDGPDAVPPAQGPGGAGLVVRVLDRDAGTIWRLDFAAVAALRVMDEGGLVAVWRASAEGGGRPGRTTFRIRQHAWTRESPLAFLASDGWAFVVASDDTCLEVVSAAPPAITAEPATPP